MTNKTVSLILGSGILNPVPIAPTFEDITDLTIAINFGASPSGHQQPVLKIEPKDTKGSSGDGVHAKIRKFLVFQ